MVPGCVEQNENDMIMLHTCMAKSATMEITIIVELANVGFLVRVLWRLCYTNNNCMPRVWHMKGNAQKKYMKD